MTRRARTVLGFVALGLVSIVLVGGAASLPLVFFPAHDEPSSSDALLVLGPVNSRLPTARALMDDGFADTLVLVSPKLANGRWEIDLCNDSTAVTYAVDCFSAVPTTTRGEARGLARLAAHRGWSSVMVLTFTPQIARARFIVSRCFTGDMRMIEVKPDLPVEGWLYQLAYQYGGFGKALSESGC